MKKKVKLTIIFDSEKDRNSLNSIMKDLIERNLKCKSFNLEIGYLEDE